MAKVTTSFPYTVPGSPNGDKNIWECTNFNPSVLSHIFPPSGSTRKKDFQVDFFFIFKVTVPLQFIQNLDGELHVGGAGGMQRKGKWRKQWTKQLRGKTSFHTNLGSLPKRSLILRYFTICSMLQSFHVATGWNSVYQAMDSLAPSFTQSTTAHAGKFVLKYQLTVSFAQSRRSTITFHYILNTIPEGRNARKCSSHF